MPAPPSGVGDGDGRAGEGVGRVGERNSRVGERDGRMGERDGRVGEGDGRVGAQRISSGAMPLAFWLLALPTAASLAWQGFAAAQQGLTAPRIAALAAGAAVLAWAWWTRRGAPRPWALACLRLPVVVAAAGLAWLSLLEIALARTTLLALGLMAVATGGVVHALVLLAATRPPGGNGRAVRAALRAGVAGTAVLVGLLGMEAILRSLYPLNLYEIMPDDPLAGPCFVQDPSGGWQGRPGFRGRYIHPEFRGSRVEMNDWGLRDGLDEASPPAPGEASVLVIGDSLSFGTGVPLEDTYQELLEARARDITARPLRVYGAAVPGTGTFEQRLQLERLVPRARPDVVVVGLFEGNDFNDTWTAIRQHRGEPQDPPPAAPPATPRGSGARLGEFLSAASTYRFWSASSAVVQRNIVGVEALLVGLGAMDPVVHNTMFLNDCLLREPPASVAAKRDCLLDELAQIRTTCERAGASLVVLVIADAIQAEPARFAEFVALRGGDPSGYDRTGFHQSVVAALRARGFEAVDTFAAVQATAEGGESAHFLEGHWNARGHRIAAEALVPVLARLLGT